MNWQKNALFIPQWLVWCSG